MGGKSVPKTNQIRGPVTDLERKQIIALRRDDMTINQIGLRVRRGHDAIRTVLKEAGLIIPSGQFKSKCSEDASTAIITLRGFTDPARISEYVRRYGQDRIRVAPATPGKLYEPVLGDIP